MATEPGTTERKLVSLRVIRDLLPLRSMGKKCLAEVDGWQCVVPLGRFKKGQLVLYFEIDSFLPRNDPRFSDLDKTHGITAVTYRGLAGYHVQTKTHGKGRGSVVSQGLVLPVEDFPEINEQVAVWRRALEALMPPHEIVNLVMFWMGRWDLSTDVGVTKWVEFTTPGSVPATMGGFPTWLCKKTDHARVQDCPNLFVSDKYKHRLYQESVKMDGASMTVYFVNKASPLYPSLHALPSGEGAVGPSTVFDNGRAGVCSHHVELNERKGGFFWEAALAADLPRKLAAGGRSIAVQGELVGDKVAENRAGAPAGERRFYVFAAYDVDAGRHLHPKAVQALAIQLGLHHVPVLGYVKIRDIASCHQDLLDRAMQREGEGLVFKCLQDGRWFKVISNTYLLKHGL